MLGGNRFYTTVHVNIILNLLKITVKMLLEDLISVDVFIDSKAEGEVSDVDPGFHDQI